MAQRRRRYITCKYIRKCGGTPECKACTVDLTHHNKQCIERCQGSFDGKDAEAVAGARAGLCKAQTGISVSLHFDSKCFRFLCWNLTLCHRAKHISLSTLAAHDLTRLLGGTGDAWWTVLIRVYCGVHEHLVSRDTGQKGNILKRVWKADGCTWKLFIGRSQSRCVSLQQPVAMLSCENMLFVSGNHTLGMLRRWVFLFLFAYWKSSHHLATKSLRCLREFPSNVHDAQDGWLSSKSLTSPHFRLVCENSLQEPHPADQPETPRYMETSLVGATFDRHEHVFLPRALCWRRCLLF